MDSTFNTTQARRRLGNELWSWAAWLLFCIISYPVITLLRVASASGLVGALMTGAVLIYVTYLGYTRKRLLKVSQQWLLIGAAAVISALIAFIVDNINSYVAALCGFVVGAEIAFIWYFLPWIIRDAQNFGNSFLSSSRGRDSLSQPRYRLLPHGNDRTTAAPAALGLILLIAFIMLGLGMVYSRGESWAPNPVGWLIATILLALALMFVERLSSFEQSAREGNLAMPPGSYLWWFFIAFAYFAICALISAVIPFKPVAEEEPGRRVGSVSESIQAAGGAAASSLQSLLQQSSSIMQEIQSAAGTASRPMLFLWLLLLLLIALLILIWRFPRSRTARWLGWFLGMVWHRFVRGWRRLLQFAKKWFRAPSPQLSASATEAAVDADPLFDIFEHLEVLVRLSPREIVLYTYHMLLSFAEMLGYGRRIGQTPFEYARVLTQIAPEGREPLMALTAAYSTAMYGGISMELPEPEQIRDSWQDFSQALTSKLSPEDIALRRRIYQATRHLEGKITQ